MTPTQIAEQFLSLPEAERRAIVDLVMATQEAQQDAVRRGDWNLYATLVALRAVYDLPPIVAD